jgi:hypothetical protein
MYNKIMSNVQFEEEGYPIISANLVKSQHSGIVDFLIKKGIFKNEKQAQFFILIIIFIFFSVAFFLFIKNVVPKKTEIIHLEGVIINNGPQEIIQ